MSKRTNSSVINPLKTSWDEGARVGFGMWVENSNPSRPMAGWPVNKKNEKVEKTNKKMYILAG